MSPRTIAHLLGLCNLVAGALLVFGRQLVMPGLTGAATPAAQLLAASLGVVLAAIAIGAWLLPATALRPYLWVFGVAVKGVAALLWGMAALTTGAGSLWTGACFDAALALVIALALRRATSGA